MQKNKRGRGNDTRLGRIPPNKEIQWCTLS